MSIRDRKEGWPKEQARGVLGTAVYTEFIWTVNAWSFMNWLEKRLDPGAQAEHRAYAEAALAMFEEAMPVTAAADSSMKSPALEVLKVKMGKER